MPHHSHERVLPLPLSVTRPIAQLSSLPIGVALIFCLVGYSPTLANEPRPPSSEVKATPPSLDVIAQNTPGYSEGFPAGVPSTYSWCNGASKPPGGGEPPSDFTAVTALGSVYPKFGEPEYSNPDAKVIIANTKTYVHLHATKEWILVQDQSEDEIAGGHFDTKASRNTGIEMKLEPQPDGAIIISSPPPGRNDAFWIVKRGSYAAGAVDGVYVQMDMKTTDPNIKLVANVGADWWRGPDSAYVQGVHNSQGAGNSNWMELSTEWSTLLFFSGTNAHLTADPPPPLAESSLATKPIRTRRAPNTPSPCLSVLAPR
jgi:hypothetical protein